MGFVGTAAKHALTLGALSMMLPVLGGIANPSTAPSIGALTNAIQSAVGGVSHGDISQAAHSVALDLSRIGHLGGNNASPVYISGSPIFLPSN